MLTFLKACFWIGTAADLLAVVLLVSPRAAGYAFGLQAPPGGQEYLYVSRVGASLMLGWAILLAWGSLKPVERRGILLLTVVPVCTGLLFASVGAVWAGSIRLSCMLPLWAFYALIMPLYIIAYRIACLAARTRR